jgi:hypothetical protein
MYYDTTRNSGQVAAKKTQKCRLSANSDDNQWVFDDGSRKCRRNDRADGVWGLLPSGLRQSSQTPEPNEFSGKSCITCLHPPPIHSQPTSLLFTTAHENILPALLATPYARINVNLRAFHWMYQWTAHLLALVTLRRFTIGFNITTPSSSPPDIYHLVAFDCSGAPTASCRSVCISGSSSRRQTRPSRLLNFLPIHNQPC